MVEDVIGSGAGGDGGGAVEVGRGGGGTDLLISLAELLVHCGGRWLVKRVASDKAGRHMAMRSEVVC